MKTEQVIENGSRPSPIIPSSEGSPWQRVVTWSLVVALTAQPLAAPAQVVADPAAGGRRPTIDAAANGVPVVHIATPSAAGVSHNQYQKFNVEARGLILNNSQVLVQTRQAGWIDGNPNLAAGTARVILNEVTSTHPSALAGYTEVAGSRADVIIANPNGITCDGCGFINTSRTVLTTGTPQFGGDGSLAAFRVTGGSIDIGGAGLDAAGIDHLDLISRSVSVNAGLWARQLNVITGANQVDYASLGVTTIAGQGGAPTVAIDVASLGGMYAHKIRLVGTEEGVGVVSAGNLAATAEDLTISNAGRVTLAGKTTAAGNILVSGAATLDNSGTLYGRNDVTVTAGDFRNGGAINAGRHLTLSAGTIDSSGTLGAGIASDGSLGAGGNLTASASGQLKATGTHLAAGSLHFGGASLYLSGSATTVKGQASLTASSGDIDHRGGDLQTQGALVLAAAGAVRNGSGALAADHIALQAASLGNAGGRITQAGSPDSRIGVTGPIDNADGRILSNAAGFVLRSGSLDNGRGAIEHAGTGKFELRTGTLNNAQGRLATNGSLELVAASLANPSGALLAGLGLNFDIAGALNNTGGTVEAGTGLTLAATSLANGAGRIVNVGDQATTLTVAGAIDNANGLIGGNGAVSVSSSSFNNRAGTLTSASDATITASSGAIDNGGGTLAAAGRLILNTALSYMHAVGDTLRGDAGITLESGADITVAPGVRLESTGAVRLAARGALDNQGRVASNGHIALSGGTLLNSGSIVADTGLSANSGSLLSNSGTMSSGTALSLSATRIDNLAAATLSAATDLTLAVSADLVNQGTLSGDNIALTAPQFDNQGAVAAMTDFTARIAGRLTNRASHLLYAGRDHFLYANELVNEEDAAVWAGRHVTIQKNPGGERSGGLLNDIGSIEAHAGDLTIKAESLANRGRTPRLATTGFSEEAPGHITTCPGSGNSYCVTVPATTVQTVVDPDTGTTSQQTLYWHWNVVRGGAGAGSAIGYEGWQNYGSYQSSPPPYYNGQPYYSTPWLARVTTQSELQAFFNRNPGVEQLKFHYYDGALPWTTNGDGGHESEEHGYRLVVSGTVQSIQPGSSSKSARLLAGGGIALDGGTLRNEASQIAALGDVRITGDTLINQGQDLQRVTTVTRYWERGNGEQVAMPLTATVTETVGAVPSSITAGGSLTGNLAAGLVNDNQAQPALNVKSSQNTVAAAATLPVSPLAHLNRERPAAGGAASLTGGVALRSGSLDTRNVTLPQGSYGLFVSAPPGAGYLIEANPLFSDRSRFISSDYFLARLGLDPQRMQKRLGDGLFEQHLVRDQLFALTGRRVLTDGASDMAQYQALMDAGYAAARRFGFQVGVELSAEQIAQLTHDLVWLVEREVAGERVLVPQVYLGQVSDADLQPSGALMAAAEIELRAPDLSNAGRITARRSLRLEGTDIANRGILESTERDGDTTLSARRDVINEGGTIAGGRVAAAAGQDFINRAWRIERGDTTPFGGTLTETEVGGAGKILAAQEATLSAGRDLTFAGGQLAAGSSAAVTAARNLELGTAQKQTRVAIVNGPYYRLDGVRTEHSGSQLAVTGDLQLAAGQDLTVTGSQARAGGTLTAVAGDNLTIAEARDRELLDLRTGGKKGQGRHQHDNETVKGSNLEGGGGLTLIAGATAPADLAVQGSRLKTGGNAILAASGNIRIESVAERRFTQDEFQGKRKKAVTASHYGVQQTETARGSVAQTGGDLALFAGRPGTPADGTIRLEGSALAANGAIDIQATGDVQLLTATSRHYESIQSFRQGKKKAEMLSFERDETRALLPTITAGSRIGLQVGGSLAAQIGTRNAQGRIEADRMTAEGAVRGESRQQVSVTRTEAKRGTTVNPLHSHVLGDLTAQGIRPGTNDSFASGALRSGQEALAALVNSGLLTFRDASRLQAVLAAPTPGGGPLIYRDEAGRIQLTVAGQARVQEVYNQLKLTESFEVRRSSGQVTQLAALAAAVALTIITQGATAELIASAAAQSAAAGAAAAGAVGAEVTAAAAAAYGSTIASTSTLAASAAAGAMAGNATAQLLTTGRLDAGQVLKSGLSGATSGAVAGYYGSSYGLERLAVETVAGCVSATINGGECSEGAKSAAAMASLAWANREMRDAMIADSKKFPGICDAQGFCLDNKSGSSVGVDGDNFKLAGGRVDLEKICADDRCLKDANGNWLRDEQGRVKLNPVDASGNPINLNELLAANPGWRSPMGGWQGALGRFAVFDYKLGSVWDRIAEAYAGPHDMLNSGIWYDSLGNIKTGVAGSVLGHLGNVANYTNVILASPFALSALIPSGTLQAIRATQP